MYNLAKVRGSTSRPYLCDTGLLQTRQGTVVIWVEKFVLEAEIMGPGCDEHEAIKCVWFISQKRHKIWDSIACFRCLDPLAEASFAIDAGWLKLQSIQRLDQIFQQ